MICVVDYGAGNLRSVQKALEHLGADARISSDARDIEKAQKIVFPGVGAFGRAMAAIDRLGLRQVLRGVIGENRPFLGICLGLQLLFERSEENPGVEGLSVLRGDVSRFPRHLKVPHLGWNVVRPVAPSPLWRDLPEKPYFYFAHSYYVQPLDASLVIGESEYPAPFPVAVQSNFLFGTQFHPEKSGARGLQILGNFIGVSGGDFPGH